MYAQGLRSALNLAERRLFDRLEGFKAIQDLLDSLPLNFELQGETYMSPREALKARKAHCFEGALIAAAALAYHGKKPYLMDFQTGYDDEDHVVALFRHRGRWGAFSKTNHSVLRYRDPVYKNVRELAMSFFHEYFLWDGRKSLRAYSAPFDLSKFAPERWVTASGNLEWLVEALDKSRHFPIVDAKTLRALRRASKIELKNMRTVEWKKPKRATGSQSDSDMRSKAQ